VRQLFLDLDGVLADFDTGYRERFNVVSDKALDNVDWSLVRDTPNFYRDLPPMPDMLELYHGVLNRGYSPIILTGVPTSVVEAPANKRAWVDKHLGPDVHMIACLSKDKCVHGRVGDILIDDWEKYQRLWLDMGGFWITHTGAEASLLRLSEIEP
jgi:5'(3')-deoxyribonucleotidase